MDILFAHKKPYESMFHARPHLPSSGKGENSPVSRGKSQRDFNIIVTVPFVFKKMSEGHIQLKSLLDKTTTKSLAEKKPSSPQTLLTGL